MLVAEVWVEFAIALVVITIAGTRLARFGDIIGIRTGLGGTWIGLMLIATVTSLPELATGLSAVALAEQPDIAVGTLIGSCVFNLAILAVLDAASRGSSVFARVRGGHERAAAFGIALVAIGGAGVLLARRGILLGIGHVGLYTPIILVLYPVFIRSLFSFERRRMEPVHDAPDGGRVGLREAVIGFWLAAAGVVAAGIWLPLIGERMAVEMGVNETFVGTLLMAFATSLPEVVVTLAALRIGAVNMAMSNLLGSNLFNILVLAPEDLVFLSGPILAAVSPFHLLSAAATVSMSAIAIVALRHPPRRRLFGRISWAGLLLLGIYLLTAYVLFVNGR